MHGYLNLKKKSSFVSEGRARSRSFGRYFITCEEENAKQYIRLFWFHGSTHRCNWKPCLYILLVSLLLLPVFVMKKEIDPGLNFMKTFIDLYLYSNTRYWCAVRHCSLTLGPSILALSRFARQTDAFPVISNTLTQSYWLSYSPVLSVTLQHSQPYSLVGLSNRSYAISIMACLFCSCT